MTLAGSPRFAVPRHVDARTRRAWQQVNRISKSGFAHGHVEMEVVAAPTDGTASYKTHTTASGFKSGTTWIVMGNTSNGGQTYLPGGMYVEDADLAGITFKGIPPRGMYIWIFYRR